MMNLMTVIFVAAGALILGVAIGNPLVGTGVFLIVYGILVGVNSKK